MSNEIKYGVLHCHSEYSVRDSAQKIKQMVARAKELGAPAIALTDHGIMVGIIEFMKACKEAEINGIPGVEAYFYPEEREDVGRPKNQHLILLAKDYQGYQAICAANQEAYSNKQNGQPCMNYEILTKYFGEGSKGHGHVISTSACMSGVVSAILLINDEIEDKLPKLKAKRDKYVPIDDTFLTQIQMEEDLVAAIDALVVKREELTLESKISLTGLRRRLKTLKEGTEEYDEAKKELEDTEQKKTNAAEELIKVKAEIAKAKKRKTEFSNRLKPLKDSADKWQKWDEEIRALLATAVPDSRLYQDAKNAALRLEEIFGKGNFFIELQYHGMTPERKSMPLLAKIAKECGIKTVVANDAHYTTNSKDDIRARTLIAAMRFNNPIEPDIEKQEGYGELYIKTDDELTDKISEIIDRKMVEESLQNIAGLCEMCHVEFPTDDHYPKFKGGVEGETADQRLRRLAEAGISGRYGDKWCKEYEDRMNYELGIISKMGYSDYLCIVQDFLEFGRLLRHVPPERVDEVPYDIEQLKNWIRENGWENNPGLTIGPGRGSAAGSIVCYLSGITSIEPMKYDLLFERFLNPERVSMPEYRANHVNPIAQGCAA